MSEIPITDAQWREKIKTMEGWSFGDNAELANELAQLVLDGKKTATASLHALYLQDNEPLPQVGEQSYIKSAEGEALCVIEVTGVAVVPFLEVDEAHARDEGEGDLSLAFWRDAHRKFFLRWYPDFTDEMDVVCERFKLVHVFER